VGGFVEVLEGVIALIEESYWNLELAQTLDGGGFEGMAMAPEIPNSGPRKRLRMAAAVCSSPLRLL